MSAYNFKRITVVPTASDFLDIVLSKTQRKTPTVVHKAYSIGRIRQFYMRKVKFAQDAFDEKFQHILDEFPRLENVHPFYADLMNVLYDRDHYKLALGQINTARHLIQQVAKDYVRLLKFGDSLYRCKQLKRAALGRMATIMRRQKDSLAYLEQVRQHLARLPSIDPNTRTLLVCGYPNVGKSSFLNSITRADVEVQPYAFTTKSLFVGHTDYKYLRWQIIDTPGILDHPLEERNTIEMQSITALAHLRACVLFFVDLSEQCGYSVTDQLNLYKSIRPLFAHKPTMLVLSKTDVLSLDQTDPERQAEIKALADQDGVELSHLSTYTGSGVMETRKRACDRLLASRVEMKLKTSKVNDILNRIHVSEPMQRDDIERPAFIPEGAEVQIGKYDPSDPTRPKLERDIEAEEGGAENYLLKDEEWKQDIIPEILEGHNVADFIDPDILDKLDALEREEEKLTAEGFYQSDSDMTDEEEEKVKKTAEVIKEKRKLKSLEHRLKVGKNRPMIPNKKIIAKRSAAYDSDSGDDDEDVDMDAGSVAGKKRTRSVANGRSKSRTNGATAMDIDDDTPATKKIRAPTRDRSTMGLRDESAKSKTEKILRRAQRLNTRSARVSEADRHVHVKLPKHLYTGKRGIGKTDRR